MKKNSAKMKLLSAAGMLGISAAMLATSTYAWFTMNKEVSVSSFTVEAKAEGGIVIGRDKAGDTRTEGSDVSKTITFEKLALYPTSTVNTTDWYHASAIDASAYNPDASTMIQLNNKGTDYKKNDPSSTSAGTITYKDKEYVLFDQFTVYPDKNASKYTDLWISECKVSVDNPKNLSNSLRIAFKAGDKVVVCAPCRNVDGTNSSVGANADGNAGNTGASVTFKGTKGNTFSDVDAGTALITKGTEIGENGHKVEVYIYFEGEDEQHYTNNLASGIEDLAISFKLKCTDVSAESSTPTGG